MQNLFEAADRDGVLRRFSDLKPSSPRGWGKMDVAQMLAHCSATLEVPCGDRVGRQRLMGRILAPFVRSTVLGEKPFMRNAPSDPSVRIADPREFERERARLVSLVERFCSRGPAAVDGAVHNFFGRLNGDQWGRLMYKHLDHHLRQFGA